MREWHKRDRQRRIAQGLCPLCGKERASESSKRLACDSCRTKYRKYYKGERESKRHRHYTLRKKYGLTEVDYNRLLMNQGRACAICRGTVTGNKRTRKDDHFYVDHDHATGKVRGLLCFSCNTALGHLKDDVALLSTALAYLLKHRDVPTIELRAKAG